MHMKRVILLFSALLAVLSTVGCTREEMDAPSVPQMTIRATIPGDSQTKASFSDRDGGGLTLSWQEHDNILVEDADDETNCAVYEILPGFTKTVAHFSGDELTMGDVFNVICPGTRASSLTQTGNGNLEHLVFNAKLEGVAREYLADIAFNSEWADDHGCSFYRGGVIKLVLNLPEAITAPKQVELAFYNGDTTPEDACSLNLTGVDLSSSHVLTAYLQSRWEDVEFSDIALKVIDGDGSCYTATKTASATLMAGCQNIMDMRSSGLSFHEELFAGGDGTQGNPYLIANAKHLDNMHAEGVLKHQERVFFQLIDDIDMQSYLSSHTWEPLNTDNPYDYEVDLDGDGHVINHFSLTTDDSNQNKQTGFFGVLFGSVHDLSFINASVTNTYGKPTAILCGFCGYSGKMAHVFNVHVNGNVTYTYGSADIANADKNGPVGGLAGRIHTCLIESCSAFDVIIRSNRAYSGGLFGYDVAPGSIVRNCWTSGIIGGNASHGGKLSGQRIGGICGGIISQNTAIINCFTTASILNSYAMGGIAGHCNLDKNPKDATDATHPTKTKTYNTIKGCIAWNDEITSHATDSDKDHYSSGAIIGYTSTHSNLISCLRKADLSFKDYNDWLPYDQENANSSTGLVVNTYSGRNYHYPYHGKSFSGTLSQAARSLGWNETVWDLSGTVPVLTGAIELAPTSGNADIPDVSTTSRAFPGNGSTSHGLTWEMRTVSTGIRYYHGYGNPNDTWWADKYKDSAEGKYQEIFVVDLDLSNTNYDVKLVVASTSVPASTVFKQMGAVATINAGYEKPSIAVKGNTYLDVEGNKYTNYPSGYPYSYMPNNTIGDTGVPNWKSEGTFYCDGHQGVRIAFDAYNGGVTGKTATSGTTVKSVEEMRNFYMLSTDNEPGFISSAPILDANYVRFGMTFYSRAFSGTDGESPRIHQGSCYSRTAVAIAYPNGDSNEPHLLLIVNDGKYTDGAHGYGMSAYQLERVIANFFGPKYMLNLDGGGSTTMCVADQGDSNTHVVNYPSDNYTGKYKDPATGNYVSGKIDHSGERARDTFICIVPAN